jgi:prophage DNA circulation protein
LPGLAVTFGFSPSTTLLTVIPVFSLLSTETLLSVSTELVVASADAVAAGADNS